MRMRQARKILMQQQDDCKHVIGYWQCRWERFYLSEMPHTRHAEERRDHRIDKAITTATRTPRERRHKR